MLTILSPAKTLDMTPDKAATGYSVPVFRELADQLAGKLRNLSVDELSRLMSVSGNLARLNHDRYRQWSREPAPTTARCAVLAFRGDAYTGLDAGTMTAGDLSFAQDHLRILSSLYGVLKPLDLIQAYRLEIGTPWTTDSWKSLYDFWGDRITRELENGLRHFPVRVLVNLASEEYFRSVHPGLLGARIIKPVFLDARGGDYRVVSIYTKKARGMMVSYIIRNRITEPEQMKGFDAGGYCYHERLSSENEWVFTR